MYGVACRHAFQFIHRYGQLTHIAQITKCVSRKRVHKQQTQSSIVFMPVHSVYSHEYYNIITYLYTVQQYNYDEYSMCFCYKDVSNTL